MEQNIQCASKKNGKESLPAMFIETAEVLLTKLKQYNTEGFNPKVLINAEAISKQYNKGNFSLQPIHLQIKSGEILGVVGENGNGKTTLLRCLAGQLALNSGIIHYTTIKNPDHYNLKHHIAFIPQRIEKWYGLLKDNLHFSASLAGITGAQNEMMVAFMLERLNLTEYAGLTWNQISSGYRTRFEIARILLQRPSLLILDEPLANLDINAQQTILTDLKFMASSVHQPMGIILSSQQLHEVEKVADTVLLIKNGNCLFRTGDAVIENDGDALELETTADRNVLTEILGDGNVQLHFNGGFYTITSKAYKANEMIIKLINNNVPVTYFRDITHSTKRFF